MPSYTLALRCRYPWGHFSSALTFTDGWTRAFDDVNPEQASAIGIDYHEFCGTISGRQQEQLFLTVAKKECKLQQSLRPDFVQGDVWMRTAPDSPGMSLRKILASRELCSSDTSYVKLKTILFYLLVKGVWQFYDSELMPKEWTKDSVEFLLEYRDRNGALTAGVFLNQPLISADFHPPSPQQLLVENALGPHRYPKIRELGIMLLEILLGKEIESFRIEPEVAPWLPGGQVRPYTDHSIAKWLFKTRVQTDNSMLKPLRDVVGRCLDDEAIKIAVTSSRKADKSGASRMSLLRKAIYELLVIPLESMIQMNYDHPYDLNPLLPPGVAPRAEAHDTARPSHRQSSVFVELGTPLSQATTPAVRDTHVVGITYVVVACVRHASSLVC